MFIQKLKNQMENFHLKKNQLRKVMSINLNESLENFELIILLYFTIL